MNIQTIQSPADYRKPAAIGQNRTSPDELPVAKKGSKAPASVSSTEQQVLTSEEQEFFADLFPASENEIRNYRTYTPSGVRLPATSGTLIDRKG